MGQHGGVGEAGGGDGGLASDSGGGISEKGGEADLRDVEGRLAEGADGLGAHVDIGILQERQETARGGGSSRLRREGRGTSVPGVGRLEGSAAAGEDAETPDAVEALELVLRSGGSGEAVSAVGPAGELELGTQTDTEIGVGEQLRELGRGALGEPGSNEVGDSSDLSGAMGGTGGHLEDAALVMRGPAADEVGNDEATLPIVVDIGRGDAPDERMVISHT